MRATEYRFDRPMTPAEVVDRIARGDVYVRSITFREGLTIRQMAELFEAKGFGAAAEFVAATRDASLVREIDPEARDLEGYLFPETYALPRRATAEQLIGRMVAAFEKTLTPELRAQAAERGLSVREFVTLSSIVEKETGRADERGMVAAVYSNRLKIGMGLQCDPTVIYALERAGRYTGNLTREDLKFHSPYNTYRYAGLPPGPIASPGRASLEAVARPADVPYLYFVSRNDGSHAFASTLEEHNRNVFEYQVKPFRR
ncbi:MAG: endolytic transglycosylase MltG [Acidobacteria bacterium]|nr:endolytic transglycosylase MltG [Acidobacteriota bacterium]